MRKPTKPKKPKKRSFGQLRKFVNDVYYPWNNDNNDVVWLADGEEQVWVEKTNDLIQMKDYDEEIHGWIEDYPMYLTETVKLSDIVNFTNSLPATSESISICSNHNGDSSTRLSIWVKRELTPAAYQAEIDERNNEDTRYATALANYTTAMAEYKKEKARWDIHQAEEKLRRLKAQEIT